MREKRCKVSEILRNTKGKSHFPSFYAELIIFDKVLIRFVWDFQKMRFLCHESGTTHDALSFTFCLSEDMQLVGKD